MHRISPNNPVRRRLFADDDLNEQAKIDNFANVLQESAAIDRKEKMQKWNFDFVKEVPLEGKYKWYPCGGATDWIGVKSDTKLDFDDNDDADEEDAFLLMKAQNEVTPKTNKDGESAPLLRKRRSDVNNAIGNDKGVRRRISFD